MWQIKSCFRISKWCLNKTKQKEPPSFASREQIFLPGFSLPKAVSDISYSQACFFIQSMSYIAYQLQYCSFLWAMETMEVCIFSNLGKISMIFACLDQSPKLFFASFDPEAGKTYNFTQAALLCLVISCMSDFKWDCRFSKLYQLYNAILRMFTWLNSTGLSPEKSMHRSIVINV